MGISAGYYFVYFSGRNLKAYVDFACLKGYGSDLTCPDDLNATLSRLGLIDKRHFAQVPLDHLSCTQRT